MTTTKYKRFKLNHLYQIVTSGIPNTQKYSAARPFSMPIQATQAHFGL